MGGRRAVSTPSKVMLPWYAFINLCWGVNYLFDPFNRVAKSSSLSYQRQLMDGSMAPWGLLFLTVFCVMVVAFALGHFEMQRWALAVGVLTWALWGVMVVKSVANDPTGQVTSPLLYFTVAVAMFASLLSITKGDR